MGNIKDFIILSHKNNKGISKKVVFILVITIILLLIFIPFTFYKTLSNTVISMTNANYDTRVIQVYEKDIDALKKLNLKDNDYIKLMLISLSLVVM